MLVSKKIVKQDDFNERNMIIENETNPAVLRYRSFIKYMHSCGQIDLLAIKSNRFTFYNIGQNISLERGGRYFLHIELSDDHKLKRILEKIDEKLLFSQKEIIENFGIFNVGINEWNNQFLIKNCRRNGDPNHFCHPIIGDAIVEMNGNTISLHDLINQQIDKCNIQIKFMPIYTQVFKPIIPNKHFICVCYVTSIKLAVDINPDDPNITLTVEI